MHPVLSLHFVFSYLVEPPEVIDSRDLEYPDRQYRVDNLEMPEPILSSDSTKVKFSKGDSSPDGLLKTSPNKSSKLNSYIFSCSLSAVPHHPSLAIPPSPLPLLPLFVSHSLSFSSPHSKSLLLLTPLLFFLSCPLHSW